MTTEHDLSENSSPENVNDAPGMTIGRLLREKREEKNLSLKVISQQTKIHIGLLEYLEADQLDKLPSKAYVRGFVKMTTKILGIDQKYALDLLDSAYAPTDPVPTPVGELPLEVKSEAAKNLMSSQSEPSVSFLEMIRHLSPTLGVFAAKILVAVFFLGLAGFYIKAFIEKPSANNEVKLPPVLTSSDQKVSQAPKAPPKPPEPEIVPSKAAEPIKVNLIQDKNQKVNVTINNINMQTISLGEKQFVDEPMEKEKYDELLPGRFRVEVTKGVETLFLNATDGDSWLTYKIDDKNIKKFVLRQGRTLFLRGSVIRLFIGNTHSLKAFYNNRPIDLSANNKSGVRNVVLPEEMKTKFMTPLFIFQNDGTVVTSDEFLEANKNKPSPNPI